MKFSPLFLDTSKSESSELYFFFFKFPVDHPGICQNQKKETTKMTAKIGCNFCQKLYEFILGLEKVKKKS